MTFSTEQLQYVAALRLAYRAGSEATIQLALDAADPASCMTQDELKALLRSREEDFIAARIRDGSK